MGAKIPLTALDISALPLAIGLIFSLNACTNQ